MTTLRVDLDRLAERCLAVEADGETRDLLNDVAAILPEIAKVMRSLPNVIEQNRFHAMRETMLNAADWMDETARDYETGKCLGTAHGVLRALAIGFREVVQPEKAAAKKPLILQ